MRTPRPQFATLSQVLGAVAQSGSAPRSHRGGQGFKSPQLHREIAGQRLTYSSHPTRRMGAVAILGGIWEIVSYRTGTGRAGGIIRLVMDTRPGMDGQSENFREPQSEPVVAGLAPQDELETDEVPDSMISEFSSLTTPYCWAITEDAAAGYDGSGRSAAGKSGPAPPVTAGANGARPAVRCSRT